MIQWKNACNGDLKRLEAISVLLSQFPHLIEFLFRPDKPEMWAGPEEMKRRAGVLSSGERLLVLVALDFWSESGEAPIPDLYQRLDGKNFNNFISALRIIREVF